ncbi:receptor-type tyrosine-protein phosphatase mu-like isoform X1 [Panulirus ornatus]|uniref:receptor-type tyrosine-protein phosphatase mu-like isoform X1 n=1 Tax=Panulirus ornatus TaxID=150431 RepID=UPI003A83D5BD
MVWAQMATRWLIFFLLGRAVMVSTLLEMVERHRSRDVAGAPGVVQTRTQRLSTFLACTGSPSVGGSPTASPGVGLSPTASPGVGLSPTSSPGVGGSPTRSPGVGGSPTRSPGVGAGRQRRSSSLARRGPSIVLEYDMSHPSGKVRARCLSTNKEGRIQRYLVPMSSRIYQSDRRDYVEWVPGDEPRGIECNDRFNWNVKAVAPFIDHSAPFVPDRLSIAVVEDEDLDLSFTTRSSERMVMWEREPTGSRRWRKATLTNDSRLIIPHFQLSDAGLYSVAPYNSAVLPRVKRSDVTTFSLLVRRCPPHRFGPLCSYWCPDCMNGGMCDDFTGDCLCTPWFSGDRCQTSILGLPDTLGEIKGEGIQVCLPSPFGCRCSPGYTGPKCDTGCLRSGRDVGCSQACENCKVTCEETDGSCYEVTPDPCSKGKLGLPRLRKPPKITSFQADSAEVSFQAWNPDYDDGQMTRGKISGYILVLTAADGREMTQATVKPPSWPLAGLQPATTYGVRVLVEVEHRSKICVASGNGRERVYTTKFTTSCLSKPPSPTGVTVSNVTSSTFLVKWQGVPNMELCNFTYCLRIQDDYFYPNATEYMVSGLQPYTNYSISLWAYHMPTHAFSSEVPFLIGARTLPTVPGRVAGLKVVDRTATSLVLAWRDPEDRPPKGQLEAFKLHWRKRGEPSWSLETLSPGASNSFTLDNLEPGKEYSVRVRAKNAGVLEYGQFASLTIRTLQMKPSAPRGLVVVFAAQTDLVIRWEEQETTAGDPISHYTVSTQIVQPFGSQRPITHHTTATSERIAELKAGQQYKVRVAACTSQLCGDETQLLVWTKPTTPHPRSGVEWVDASGTTITIRPPTVTSFPVWQWVVVSEEEAKLTKDLAEDLVLNDDLPYRKSNSQVWIAAKFALDDVNISEFVVGDGKRYSTYYNRPLETNTKYCLAVVTEAKAGPYRELYASEPKTFQSRAPFHTGALVASILVLLLLGLIFAGVFWWRRFGYKRFHQSVSSRQLNSYFPFGFFRRRSASAAHGHTKEVDEEQVETTRNNYHSHGSTTSSAADDESNCDTTTATTTARRVYRAEAEAYLARAIHSPETEAEFLSVPASMSKSCSDAERQENRMKNRYGYNLPYNETRVKLACLPGFSSDYINASYIQGHSRPRAFIATQGPMDYPFYTVGDFWRMVWETNTHTIVMLTTLKKTGTVRVVQYWPQKEGQPMVKDDIQVTLLSSEVKIDFIIRRLQVSKGTEVRSVVQYHYKAWPDHALPQSPFGLAQMLNHLMDGYRTGPITVHCSAGTGPTGTIILVMYILEQLSTSGYMDVCEALTTLRNGRAKLVENKFEYVFSHQLLQEILTGMKKRYHCGDFPREVAKLRMPQPHTRISLIQKQFKELKALPKDLTYNIAKNPVCA